MSDEFILDRIGSFVRLQPCGQKWLATCPFCEEWPLVADSKSNTYHCHYCDAHGHADDFETQWRSHQESQF